jgi:hypothetical protein
MRRMTPLLLLAVLLTACGPSEAPKQPNIANRGRIGRRSDTVEGIAPAMQDRPCDAWRRVMPQGGRGHAQAILWRRKGALHAPGEAAQVLIAAFCPPNFVFLRNTRSDTPVRLRRFSCVS